MQRVWFITGAESGFGRALAEAALGRFGRVDALANIAGRGSLGAAAPSGG